MTLNTIGIVEPSDYRRVVRSEPVNSLAYTCYRARLKNRNAPNGSRKKANENQIENRTLHDHPTHARRRTGSIILIVRRDTANVTFSAINIRDNRRGNSVQTSYRFDKE